MVNRQEEAVRRLLGKYASAERIGAQIRHQIRGSGFARDDKALSGEKLFNLSKRDWIDTVVLGLDPSFRQDSEYSPGSAREVGMFLREISEAGLKGFVAGVNSSHVQRIRRNYVPLDIAIRPVETHQNVDSSTLEGVIRSDPVSKFVIKFPTANGEMEFVEQNSLRAFRAAVHSLLRVIDVSKRERERGGGGKRSSHQPRPDYTRQTRTSVRPLREPAYLTHTALEAFADFTRFMPRSSSTNYTTVVGLLEAIVGGIERLPNHGTELQEKSRLVFVTHNARNSIISSEGIQKWAGVPEYVAGLSSNVDTVIRRDYTPLETVVAEAMEGLGLEGIVGLQLQLREQLKEELSKSANVVRVYQYSATGKGDLYVNWRDRDGMLRTADRIVSERAAKPLYNQGNYAAVQQLLKVRVRDDTELWFISVSSSFRSALVPPTSNKARGRSLGSLKEATAKYAQFLQRHRQGASGFEAELQEDMRREEEFLAQIRQQKSQPKEYVKSVEAVFRDSKFMSYAPQEQNHEGAIGKVFGFLSRR